MPIIVDDLSLMWPSSQHDNIIVVKESKLSEVWSVSLFPHVQNVLAQIHTDFFRQLDCWLGFKQNSHIINTLEPPPSPIKCYREVLRAHLKETISNS